jgi:hypothetical protein
VCSSDLVRLATTLVEIDPNSDTIGMMFDFDDDDDFDALDISEEQREVLFGILHAAKRQAHVVDSEPLDGS